MSQKSKIDRLREIARIAQYGLPPHSLDDVRFLLDVIVDQGCREIAEAAKYRSPHRRCEICHGEGCGECGNVSTTTV